MRTIELLKVRFGEDALHVCDVMLKDMTDSKRINDHIQQDISSVVEPLIISRMFWPEVEQSSLHLTPKLRATEEDYGAAFNKFKPDKHLRWVQELGKVSLRLEMEDRVIEADVTPLQACVAELFEERERWTPTELAERLGVDEPPVLSALAVWEGYGLLRDAGEAWETVEVEQGASAPMQLERPIGKLSACAVELTAVTTGFARPDETAVLEQGAAMWPSIVNVLTNLGPQPLDSLQRTLALQKTYSLTSEELRLVLERAAQEGTVSRLVDGRWVLPQRNTS